MSKGLGEQGEEGYHKGEDLEASPPSVEAVFLDVWTEYVQARVHSIRLPSPKIRSILIAMGNDVIGQRRGNEVIENPAVYG